MESVIKINNLTKDYGSNRGVFDVSLEVRRGEVFGFLGPNGAGKSTAIRHLLGFQKAQQGSCEILGLDCWKKPSEIQKHIGYIAGEIAFPSGMNGWQFLKHIASIRKVNLDVPKQLCEYFQFDPNANIKRMSKGMKQKVGLVVAFMHDPEIIILDEPTSGLDPLMQAKFCDLIKREKARGKTILMSSHIFEEIEKTCDRLAIIKNGRIVTQIEMNQIEHNQNKQFEIRFKAQQDAISFSNLNFNFSEKNFDKNRVKVFVNDSQINNLMAALYKYQLEYISEIKFTLEQYFMEFYKEGGQNYGNSI